MQRLASLLERIAHAIEAVAGIIMGLVTLLVVASAIGRYLFAYPLPDAFDLSRLLLGAAIMWGFASVGYRGSHIKVDLLAEWVRPGTRRWIDTFAWTVLLIFAALLTWKMFGRVSSAAGSGESTMDLRMPAWPMMALIWLGVAVSLPAILARLILIVTGRGTLDHFESIETGEPDA
ncbi:TRAP transporter small permease [Silicimonas algicola]|uniref:TRAP transporter small permease protein n=1 Tax=Silicimonas algicola TaxID=1826607 RepID=A0A316GBN2_9RHOB|nr:TRAP transporter small permease [Silicimonas algicola]AZQ68123.1 TRAP transporter small permease [Silicimonas algicola]PWK57416.1 TRAP-type C4-dicarboxylate transport system permease small subunit [Silicimonas algicola]